MKLYLSGKMGDLDKAVYKENFKKARLELQSVGFEVEDPSLYDYPDDITWAEAMKKDLPKMLTCDGVALLADWADSRGALIEAGLAIDLEMRCLPYQIWVNEYRESAEAKNVALIKYLKEKKTPARISEIMKALGWTIDQVKSRIDALTVVDPKFYETDDGRYFYLKDGK